MNSIYLPNDSLLRKTRVHNYYFYQANFYFQVHFLLSYFCQLQYLYRGAVV